jgi:hypothetical protein
MTGPGGGTGADRVNAELLGELLHLRDFIWR